MRFYLFSIFKTDKTFTQQIKPPFLVLFMLCTYLLHFLFFTLEWFYVTSNLCFLNVNVIFAGTATRDYSIYSIGQILNRFSRDIYLMDDELPWIFSDFLRVRFYFLYQYLLLMFGFVLTSSFNKFIMILVSWKRNVKRWSGTWNHRNFRWIIKRIKNIELHCL